MGKWKIAKYTHNFFFDDLKLFATNRATLIKQLDIVTTFSEDIGVKFDLDASIVLDVCHQIKLSQFAILGSPLEKVVFHNSFKIGKVSPIYKSGDAFYVSNHRQLLVLPEFLITCLPSKKLNGTCFTPVNQWHHKHAMAYQMPSIMSIMVFY